MGGLTKGVLAVSLIALLAAYVFGASILIDERSRVDALSEDLMMIQQRKSEIITRNQELGVIRDELDRQLEQKEAERLKREQNELARKRLQEESDAARQAEEAQATDLKARAEAKRIQDEQRAREQDLLAAKEAKKKRKITRAS